MTTDMLPQQIIWRKPAGTVNFKPDEEQVRCTNEILATYKKWPSVVNTSSTGTGKTFLACNVALKLGFKNILVVGPQSSYHGAWVPSCHRAGLNLFFVSYTSATGQKTKWEEDITTSKITANGLLYRIDRHILAEAKKADTEPKKITHTDFTPTHLLAGLKDTLIVFDEIHRGKNDSGQSNAVTAIVAEVLKNGADSSCKVLLLSATLFDKMEHAKRFLYLLGIVRSRQMYYVHDGVIKMESDNKKYGFKEMMEFAEIFGDSYHVYFARDNDKFVNMECHKFWQRFVVNRLITSMNPPNFDHEITFQKSHFYVDNDVDRGLFLLAIESIENAIEEATRNGKVASFMDVIPHLITIQTVKARYAARRANQLLSSNPNSKVLFFTGYHEPLQEFMSHLKFPSHELSGNIKEEDRTLLVSKFNQDDNEVRCIAATLGTCAESVSLHDMSGKHPRFALITPIWSLIQMSQAAGRIVRKGLRSNAHVESLWLHGENISVTTEGRLLSILTRKGNVVDSTRSEETKAAVPLPSLWNEKFEVYEAGNSVWLDSLVSETMDSHSISNSSSPRTLASSPAKQSPKMFIDLTNDDDVEIMDLDMILSREIVKYYQ